MPALSGQIEIVPIADDNGQATLRIWLFYTPADSTLRDDTVSTSTGNRTGALVVDNATGVFQRLAICDVDGEAHRTFAVLRTGLVLTVAQCAALDPPLLVIQDFNGLTMGQV